MESQKKGLRLQNLKNYELRGTEPIELSEPVPYRFCVIPTHREGTLSSYNSAHVRCQIPCTLARRVLKDRPPSRPGQL